MESLEIMPIRVRITAILRKAILSGEYQAGQELSLTETAEKLGVSRTPVREAFQTLASERLIQLRMNRGAIVLLIDNKFIRDHYEMRMLLEGEAAYRAAERGMDGSKLLREQRALLEGFEEVPVSQIEEGNVAVHTAIWRAADNQKLYDFLNGLWNGPSIRDQAMTMTHHRLSLKEHIQVLERIEERNAEKARDAMRAHIGRFLANMLMKEEKKESNKQEMPSGMKA